MEGLGTLLGGWGASPGAAQSQPGCPPSVWTHGHPGHRHAGFGMAPGGMLAPRQHVSVVPLPAPPCCVPALLPARQPLACTVSLLSHSAAWGLVGPVLPASSLCCCGLRAALWAGEWSVWERHAPLGLPLWQDAGSLLSAVWGLRTRAVPFDPCPLATCSGSSAGRGFLPLLCLHYIHKPGGSTPGSSIPRLQLPPLG